MTDRPEKTRKGRADELQVSVPASPSTPSAGGNRLRRAASDRQRHLSTGGVQPSAPPDTKSAAEL
jgi:hypothetical protein